MRTRGQGIIPTLIGATLTMVWLAAVPGEAFADNKKEAGAKFKEGVALYKDENFEDALDAFLASNELYPHPDTLVNIANCYAELYNFAKAMEYFERYLDAKGDDLTSAQKKEITNKMERVGKKVGKLTIKPEDLEGELIVDGETIGRLPLEQPVYLEAGLHQVVLQEEEEIFYSKQVNIIGGAKTVVDVDLTAMEEEDAEVEEGGDEGEEAATPKKPKKKKKKKKKGLLRVEVDGEETAVVLVNGEEAGETPFETQLKEGSYQLNVKTDDKPTWKGEVPVESEKHTKVKVNFNAKKKSPNVNNPMFFTCLGAAVPTLVGGVVLGVLAKNNNDDANRLFEELEMGLYTGNEAIRMTQKQNDLVDNGDKQKKAAIGLLVSGGVLAAASVASIFIFMKEKPTSKGSFEISGVSPLLDPGTGSYGLGMQGTF